MPPKFCWRSLPDFVMLISKLAFTSKDPSFITYILAFATEPSLKELNTLPFSSSQSIFVIFKLGNFLISITTSSSYKTPSSASSIRINNFSTWLVGAISPWNTFVSSMSTLVWGIVSITLSSSFSSQYSVVDISPYFSPSFVISKVQLLSIPSTNKSSNSKV